MPRSFGTFTSDQCPGGVACLFSAIRADLKVLGAADSTDQAKLESLKFLGHWIGDLHQPLHVSFEDDKGGGKIKENGPCVGDLHGVWDRCIIEQTLGQSARDIARDLEEVISENERTTWGATQVHEWATESLAFAEQPPVEYCIQEGSTCRYDANREEYQEGTPERVVNVDAAYFATHKATVQRLRQGVGAAAEHDAGPVARGARHLALGCPHREPADRAGRALHRRQCGDLDAGVEGLIVWIVCDCGARMTRRVDEGDVLASND